jgi:hypothetical protein
MEHAQFNTPDSVSFWLRWQVGNEGFNQAQRGAAIRGCTHGGLVFFFEFL